MRILLVGEYSGLHNTLKKGLVELGHEVVLLGDGDGFKNYPVDIFVDHSYRKGFLKKLKVGVFRLTGFDLGSFQVFNQTTKKLNELQDFDVVQLINESAFHIQPNYQKAIYEQLLRDHKKLFLLSCGVDHTCMRYMMDGKFDYSIMSPYLEDNQLFDDYKFQLQYLNKDYENLHKFLFEHMSGVIASDLDYHIPLKAQNHPKYLGMISNPIDVSAFEYQALNISGKISIFHGVNKKAYKRKGNRFFDEALQIIEKKHPDKVDIIRTESLPYDAYIKAYDDCHILLDQVYAYDQGYNALEAMAKGKVVFTGAEQEWLDYYGLKEDTVAINALPDATKIAEKLEWLIMNPQNISMISHNARAFVEEEHDHLKSAKAYLEKWRND